MTSRVVPAIAVTIERLVPLKRLNNVDLPTLGRPTSTTWRNGLGDKSFPYVTDLKGLPALIGCREFPSLPINTSIQSTYAFDSVSPVV